MGYLFQMINSHMFKRIIVICFLSILVFGWSGVAIGSVDKYGFQQTDKEEERKKYIEKLSEDKTVPESSDKIQKRVVNARKIQNKRFQALRGQILTNSEMNVRHLKQFAFLSPQVRQVLDLAAKRLDLSARAYHRVIKLARTIADLEASNNIEEPHIFEALQYRPKTT